MIKPRLFFVPLLVFIAMTTPKTIIAAELHPGVEQCDVCHSLKDGACKECGNIKWIRCNTTTPNSGSMDVLCTTRTGTDGSFADGDDGSLDGVCEVCHTETIVHTNTGDGINHFDDQDCITCHPHSQTNSPVLFSVKPEYGPESHRTHIHGNGGPGIGCLDCHLSHSNYALFAGDGLDIANTTACDNCHSAGGAQSAKDNWLDPASWRQNEASFCGSCHDETPGNTQGDGTGDSAPNVLGDSASFGFYVTGHGKASGNYERLSWQESGATGNPSANKSCSDCHDLNSQHYGNPTKRLLTGYENDEDNSNCNNCHAAGQGATADPQFYTNSVEYELSAHGLNSKINPLTGNPVLCTDCHEVHGSAGTYAGMTKGNKQELCFQCHDDPGSGGIQNNAVSGSDLADDIEQAFGMSETHDLGTSFTINSKTYTLECTSCHNVHLVTGKYWEAEAGKTPVTMFSNNISIWGDESGEKMDDYAGSGTYRTPKTDTFAGSQLPDYATFCLDCHAQSSSGHANFGIDWDGDPHGKQSANQPNGYGVCPNWYSCGKAEGWDGDDCVSDQATCWPVITRGCGDELFSRPAYTHAERIAGANFTLSCTDCHEAHGSDVSSMLRSNPNGGEGTWIWNTMCNNCHYYYSDFHAGMSCGPASCHVASSIHRMDKNIGSGGTRSFDQDLVFHYPFEGNIKDSGTWQMDGQWFSGAAGSFTTGKSGQAILLNGDQSVQVGTENEFWSTDAGYHGTWVYTEMKYNTTLEAWVYPTDDANNEYSIFTKHVGYNDGGYAFTLQKIDGTLRAAFNAQIDNNEGEEGGASGVRGAYSSVAIPLNTWTHVAATFDTFGLDKDTDYPSVGRIRIYVSGEDVTTSDSTGNLSQPGVDETSIFAYSENSPWNEGICYNGHWCASEFSIGGFTWQSGFVGRIDEAMVWNVTQPASYFEAIDPQSSPWISEVKGIIGSNELTVTFSEGVYTDTGQSGALGPGDFALTDSDNERTIVSVSHTAGSATATLTLSSALDGTDDIGVDIVAAVSNSIYDEYGNAAGTNPVTITMISTCPSGGTSFQLNESAGSAYVLDEQTVLLGTVSDAGSTIPGDGYFHGDGVLGDGVADNYIEFGSRSCLKATTALTLEARIKVSGVEGTGNAIQRVFERAGNNYQMSVWRNTSAAWNPPFSPPADVAVIAFWVRVADDHGTGQTWKPVKTDYSTFPIVNDHWYKVKVVWNSEKPGGTPDQPFVPADIFVDDQGTDGAGGGENWAGYRNCTDSDQLQQPDAWKLYTGDSILSSDDDFAIGSTTAHTKVFHGLIDWISWQGIADYSGVDDPPN